MVWFDRIWFDVLVMVFEIMIGRCLLVFLNSLLSVNSVVLVFSVLKIVLMRNRLMLLLSSVFVCW